MSSRYFSHYVAHGFSIVTGSFTADASIFAPTTIASFTADAVLVSTLFRDDFNRTESPGVTGVTSHMGHLLVVQDDFTVDNAIKVVNDGNFLEAEFRPGPHTTKGDIVFDFLTSTDAYYDVRSPQHYSGSNHYNGWAYVYEDPTDGWVVSGWGALYPISVTPDTWYTLRLRYDAETTRLQSVRVWQQGTPEPATWDFQNEAISAASWHFYDPYIYISFYGGTLGPDAQLDNFRVEQSGTHVYDFFTADAQLRVERTGSFTADAYLFTPGAGTFTADAYLIANTTAGSFTANALLKKVVSTTFTANSRLVSGVSQTFTADAFLKKTEEKAFTANAYLFRPPVIVDGRVVTGMVQKTSTMHILDHRPRPLPVYLPPKIPDESEVPEDALGGPPCLSPCFGAGAGVGTGYGANGGATVVTMTHCTSGSCPERYFNSGDYWLGKGPIGSTTHCDCATSHSQSAHVNRMWISYLTIPDGPFRMRAKMIWDVGAPPNATVNVYANSSLPPVDLGDCDSSGAYWDNGNLIGRMQFSASGNGTISERDVWFQETASSLTIDPGAISTNTFRFELSDEGQYYRAEFKTTTNDIVTD